MTNSGILLCSSIREETLYSDTQSELSVGLPGLVPHKSGNNTPVETQQTLVAVFSKITSYRTEMEGHY